MSMNLEQQQNNNIMTFYIMYFNKGIHQRHAALNLQIIHSDA